MALRKSSDRGFWISKLFYYQSIIYFYYNSLRFWSFTFFSAANPAIKYGGMLDDKKSDTYRFLPDRLVPVTIVTDQSQDFLAQMRYRSLDFPIIVKPDVGFKGFLVAKIDNEASLFQFVQRFEDKSFIIQEYVDFEREYSILLYRYPISGRTYVSSFIEKSYPQVLGDGIHTLEQLIDDDDNPFIDKSWVKEKWGSELSRVLRRKEIFRLDDIGNYSRGAKFHSLNHLLDNEYIEWADSLMRGMEGIDFCRLDLKADSERAMLQNEYKIMELNGAKSEPLHIYDPMYSFADVIKDIHTHWTILSAIVRERLKLSFTLPSFKEGFKSFKVAKNIGK